MLNYNSIFELEALEDSYSDWNVEALSGELRNIYSENFIFETLLLGKWSEDVRFQSERDLRRAIKVLFDEHKIDIALPKVFIEDVKK